MITSRRAIAVSRCHDYVVTGSSDRRFVYNRWSSIIAPRSRFRRRHNDFVFRRLVVNVLSVRFRLVARMLTLAIPY